MYSGTEIILFGSGSTLGGKRLLVVEDDPDNRDFLVLLIETEGATAVPAASAQEALETLEQAQFDVIISDIGLPGDNGYTFIQQWRSREVELGHHPISAIALTAFAFPQDRQKALEAGYGFYLTKPVDTEQLLKLLVEITSGRADK